MNKLLFYDLETTGVKFWKNGIHQMSGMIVIDGIVKETFNYKVQPNPAAIIEDEALAIAGVTRKQIQEYDSMNKVHRDFVKLISSYVDKFDKTDKFHLVGYNNASFDNQFLRAFFTQCGDKYFGSWFWSDTIDVMVLAADKLKNERSTMPNFKLMTVAAHVGITVDESKLHDALYDVELTKAIYEKLN